ncbi:MAG TPA: hypothetical protein VKB04_03140 [Anaerolineales bacterium]|nr:hypothetical protein [Anaerolineales bacterium]
MRHSVTLRFTPGAKVEDISQDDRQMYRLSIPAGKADNYRLAQVDDYAQSVRSRFPLQFPMSLSLLARTSSNDIPGTWGFGLWNDPFGLSLGFGGNPFRLPTMPNAAWFFGASRESYLSFRDPRASTTPPKSGGSAPPTGISQHEVVANGFLAQTFRSPRFHPTLIPAGLALPFSRRTTRRLLGRVIDEEGVALHIEVTQWHKYRLDWHEEQVSFEVDNVQVFESNVSPNPPLGLVIWIDNQYAAFTPEGKIGFGVLENPEPVWLEIKDIELA